MVARLFAALAECITKVTPGGGSTSGCQWNTRAAKRQLAGMEWPGKTSEPLQILWQRSGLDVEDLKAAALEEVDGSV